MPAARPNVAQRSAASRGPNGDSKAATRSRLTNGRDVLPGVDQRSAIARRYRDLIGAIVSDQGGVELLAEARVQLIRRFAAASVIAEQMEARLANGEEIDISEHALLCSTLVRVSSRIGINRRAKDLTPTLERYLSDTQEQNVAEVDE